MTRLPVWQLFVLAVGIWGTTWHVILYQLAHATPEFGVTLRFALAGLLVLAYAAWRGERVPRRAGAHGLLALQGLFMYTLAYLCVYHAERHVPSGLVALGYSVSPLLSGLAAYGLWRSPISRGFLAGGVIGAAGVGLIFWPEIAQTGARPTAGLGLAFTVGAVALSTVGSLAASRNAHHGVPFWAGLGMAMLYGAIGSGVVLLLMGQTLSWPTALSWWVSLLYLAAAGTVVAFASFLILQQRVGVGRAGTVGVMTPVLALAISTLFEGYRPDGWTLAGAVLAIVGNALMLRPMAPREGQHEPAAGR